MITATGLELRAGPRLLLAPATFRVAPGDRVAILAANCPEWIVTFWATISLGAIAQYAGLAFLAAVVLFVTYNDILRNV